MTRILTVLRMRLLALAACVMAAGASNGCATVYYSPNAHNVPLFQSKGEWRAAASLNQEGGFFGSHTQGGDVQAAYAFSEHLGVVANAYFARKTDEQTREGGTGRLFEGGVGYFRRIGSRMVFETYGGAGGGALAYDGPGAATRASVRAARAFLQPSIGVTSKWFDAAFSLRLGALRYSNPPDSLTDTALMFAAQDIADHRSSFLAEPAVTLRVGPRQLKLQVQFGASRNLSHPDFPQVERYATIGGYLALGR